MVGNYGAALRLLWKGRCTVTVLDYDTNETTGRSVKVEKNVLEDEPCRISFGTSPAANDGSGANSATQTIKLFISSAVSVPPGSKLTVTQNGVTEAYASSGKPKVYSTHQEIELTLFKRWA